MLGERNVDRRLAWALEPRADRANLPWQRRCSEAFPHITASVSRSPLRDGGRQTAVSRPQPDRVTESKGIHGLLAQPREPRWSSGDVLRRRRKRTVESCSEWIRWRDDADLAPGP